MIDYSIASDVVLLKELIGCTTVDLAASTGIGSATLERWLAGGFSPSRSRMEAFYAYAFQEGFRLNEIKAQLHREQVELAGHIVLFHGAKSDITGPLSLEKSRPNNDFGRGFYCGESLEQSAMFVADSKESSLYIVEYSHLDLHEERYHVDEDWMLTVAWHRGRLKDYAGHPRIQALRDRVSNADVIIAPIADNRMFEVIDSFIDGEITDLQCRHSLSATSLGNQHVFVSPKALSRVVLLEHCFLCQPEKQHFLEAKRDRPRTSIDKSKIARRQFRGQGRYIEELLS